MCVGESICESSEVATSARTKTGPVRSKHCAEQPAAACLNLNTYVQRIKERSLEDLVSPVYRPHAQVSGGVACFLSKHFGLHFRRGGNSPLYLLA